MKSSSINSGGMIVLILLYSALLNASTTNDSLFFQFFQRTNKALLEIELSHSLKMNILLNELKKADQNIFKAASEHPENLSALVNSMQRKDRLKDQILKAEREFQIELSKIRYRKGIDFIKMIYEKTLGLEHHFTSLQTYQNVALLSNPNMFPEFQKTKEIINDRLGKKQSVQLPIVFESNPFVSLVYSLAASLFGNGEKSDREEELNQIACILDFTVRMNADLNLIYYETEFLKESNIALKEECVLLFKEYTDVIGYKTSLTRCRNEDDWERLFEFLDDYVENLEVDLEDPSSNYKAYKKQVDLEFSIDRLLHFMNKYNVFISQGEKYYQKFKTILNNYTNDSICQSQLPYQFSELKNDIDDSIIKFNEAYNISELRGSKLKDLMYGLTDQH